MADPIFRDSSDVGKKLLWRTVSRDLFQSAEEDFLDAFHSTTLNFNDRNERQPLIQSAEKGKFCEKPQLQKGVNWVVAAFLIVNAALGIGILNFPAAYDQAGGIVSATVIQIVMLTVMMSTMLILAYCSDFNGDSTYHEVLMTMCGRRAQQLAAASITCTLYCVCVAILIIIGDQIDSLFHSVFGPRFCNYWYLRRHFTIPATSICLILPLCYSKRIDFLRYAGTVGIFAMLYPVFLTVYGYIVLDTKPELIKTYPDNLTEMFAVLPVLGLGYQCQEVIVPIYACMRKRNLCDFTKASFLAMGFLFILYSIIGICGYLSFGANVAHNIMKMYNADDPVVMIGVGALIIKMVVSYPILAHCGRDAAAGLYAELAGIRASEFEKNEYWRRITVATIWFASSLALAVSASGIGIVIKYLGSVASANIFIYPGICLMMVAVKQDPNLETWRCRLMTTVAVAIAAFGAFCLGVVLFQAILSPNSDVVINRCL